MVPVLVTFIAFAILIFLAMALKLSGAIERAVQKGAAEGPIGYSNIITSAIAKHVDKDDKPTRKMVLRLRLLLAIIVLCFLEILVIVISVA